MNSLNILKALFSIHLLLGFSFFLFLGIQKLLGPFMQSRQGWSRWVRIAQCLVLASIVAPLVFHSLPTPRVPSLAIQIYSPAPEAAVKVKKISRTKKSLNPNLRALPFFHVDRPLGFRERALKSLRSNSGWVLLSMAMLSLFLALKLRRSSQEMRRLLSSAICVRKLGKLRIAVTDTTKIPFSVRHQGLSWVVIPSYLLHRTRDFRIACRHEIQHHRSLDTAWALLIEWIVCVFYSNPAIHFWKRKITEYQEFSCDQTLLGRRGVDSHDYGSCLVRVAETALGARSQLAGTAGMASNSKNPAYVKSFLRRRIEMLPSEVSNGKTRPRFWVAAVLGTLSISVTVAVAFAAEQSLRSSQDHAVKVNPGVLTVDPEIQQIAEGVLSRAVESEHAKAGFALVADPNTGRILAVANIDKTRSRTGHWALAEKLEQASFFKGIVVAQALEEGLTTPQDRQSCENGRYVYHGRVYRDWKTEGWDSLSTEETITNSSDICSMKIGEKIGPDGLLMMLQDFGFGPEGIAQNLPEARTGDLPSITDRPNLVPQTVSGFGFKSTPLEILQAYSAIANGGSLMMPRSANDPSIQLVRRVMTPEAAVQAKEILHQVVVKGTGKKAHSDLYTTAGKTATAWTADYFEWMNGHPGDFAGFVGFAPLNQPQLAIYVGMIDPLSKDGQHAHGGEHAAPVFKELTEKILQWMKVPPEEK
jgi:beta-lactamase regulating signal transducer with metallopeptidase domain